MQQGHLSHLGDVGDTMRHVKHQEGGGRPIVYHSSDVIGKHSGQDGFDKICGI